MLGAAMQKSPTSEAVKPFLIAKNFNQNPMKSILPEVREAIKTNYSTHKVNSKEYAVGGAGEIVTKKLVKKLTKGDDEKIGKKTIATVSDKIPKKLAQRAKGTTSINKPNIKTSSEFDAKTKASICEKVSYESQKSKNDSIDKLKSKSENRKHGVMLEKKFKSKLKKPGIKIPKIEPHLHSPFLNEPIEVRDSQTNETVLIQAKPETPTSEDKIKELKDQPKAASTTTTTNYSQGMNFSLLERLQLGVKSYFSSRNSIICSDKNKKEGGNQTRARVGTEVKEDAQKTDPGFEFKNYFCISESGSSPDQLSLNSNLGGESNNFLTDNIQISQNLKHKKLKNNVRIQIPRKGYFYRSSALSKTPEQQQPSGPPELLESQHIGKNESKNQNSGMAPTSAQIPRVPIKKRSVKSRKSPVEADMELFYSDEDSVGSIWSGSSSWSIPRVRLLERDVVYDPLGSAGKRRGGKNTSLSLDLYSELGERDGERVSALDKSLIADGEKKRKKNITALGGDCFEDLELGSKTPSTLKTLTNCINSVLGNDELFNNLEITPVNPERDIKLESISKESTKPLITTVPINSIPSGSTYEEKFNPTAVLMGEIDLHLELQNYLKAFSSFNISKTRTKNTLHSNKPFKTQENEFLRTEELTEGHGNKKSLLSPTSPNNAEFSSSDEPEEERIESRLPRSQTQIPDIFNQILKKTSTEKVWNQAHLSNNSIDNYEKIFPFGSELPLKFNSSPVPYGDPVFDNLQTRTPPKPRCTVPSRQKSPNNLDLSDKTEIFYNVLQDYVRVGWRQKKSLNSLTSYLFPLLNEKGTNKLKKLDLINFAKEISTRRGWKNLKEKENVKLKMYVNMFQKILKSPLTFRQIIYLNSIISAWESNSDEFVKYLKKKFEKDNAAKKTMNLQQKVSKSKETLPSSKSTSTLISPKGKPEVKPSKNLQMTLESFLNLEGEDYSSLSALKGKVGLIDVKLTGNQIQVKDLSFVNKDIPSSKKSESDGSSELIIESVQRSQINDIFNENPKQTVNKQPKKNINLNEKVNKKVTKTENLSPRFEYNENQLRSQHPIDPISEFPEPKIKEEKLPPLFYSMKMDPDFLKNAFENPFDLENFVKPNELKFANVERLKMQLPLSQKAPELPKTIKSMVDIKTNTPISKKVRKIPSEWSRSFFCYSSLHSPQNKLFKEGSKEKKTGGVSKTPKKKKKQRQNTGAAILKPDYNWRTKNEGASDISNIEFLFFDKPPQKISKNQSDSIVEEETKIWVDNQNRAIVHHPSNQSMGNRSFSLDLIHSDSFLKGFSHMSILERDTKLFFQNGPDFNLGPLMWLDRKKDPNALTTFFLTPEQYENADLPNDDVMVILRKKLPMTFQKSSNADEVPFEDCLPSYGNSDPEAKKKKRKSKTVEKKFCPPLFKERKTKTRCQTCQFLSKQVSPTQKSGKPNLGSVAKTDKTKNENTKAYSRKIQSDKCFKNTLEDKRPKKEETKEKIKEKEATVVAAAENLSKVSVNLEDIPLELLEALKRTFNKVENLKKKKIISAIEKKKQIGKRFLDVKPTKSFTLKIHCENPTKGKQTKEVSQKNKTGKSNSTKINNKDLKNDESLFFDADEKNFKDGVEEEMKGSFRPCNSISPTTEDQPNPLTTDNPSNEHQEEKSEEFLLTQISDCIVEGQISCSLLLLDSFLKKKEKSNTFNQGTEMVEENTENLIASLERNTWQVLMILEALTQLVEKNSNETLKEQVQSTKDVVNKILVLNINRLANFRNLNSTNQLPDDVDHVDVENNTFGIVRQCLKNLKQMFALKGTTEETKKENQVVIYENQEETVKPFDLKPLKEKSDESDMSEIQKMKNKVMEELKSLEKMFLDPKGTSSSILEEQGSEEGQSGSEGTSSEDWLHRTYDCMHLMQCLLKVWDTRMSLNNYASDGFR